MNFNRKEFLNLLAFAPFVPAMKNLNDLENLSNGLPLSPKMPVLFLGHGSPMNAIEENEFVTGFRNIAKTITKPRAILCVSAHWYTKGTKLTSNALPPTIHDFGGFPKALFDVQYPAKGNPELAAETKVLVEPTLATLDDSWGLDHGAWSVIKHLYPKADIPVIQMSIDYTQTAEQHFSLGSRLQKLRNKGVLIIGSGNIVHNLGMADFRNMHKDNYGFDWAVESRDFINTKINNYDFKALTQLNSFSKALQLAIPTPDHYLPLMYVLGLHEKGEKLSLFNDKMLAGSLSMTSVKIG
jgi:4,5-DOPA dioxygenase extradiol